ncbi:MAG: VOC family protein [Gemmataceae bacterium]|nr:VOC family protein [Gemmataceae bacterium]
MRVNYAIVFVSDMKRSVAFYRDVLGLPLRFESPGWTELATEGATLALHASEDLSREKTIRSRYPPDAAAVSIRRESGQVQCPHASKTMP